MEMLPNFENAQIPIEKLTEYCLNISHPSGKEKAKLFKSILGLGSSDAELLKKAIFEGLSDNKAIPREVDEYGKRYTVLINIRIFDKSAIVTTGWIVKTGEDFPKLTSCYIDKGNQNEKRTY